jgi:hypothetical protein
MEKTQTISLTDDYVRSLSDKEYQGYMIAKSHLGSSFDLEKSLGFIDWKQGASDPQKVELLNTQQKSS